MDEGRPINWLLRISKGLTIAQLSARLRCAAFRLPWTGHYACGDFYLSR
jgi:hypothetical protein